MGGLSGLSGWSGPSGLTGLSSDWFVDSVNGNDANSGQTAGQALQTIAALVAAGIAANDQIALAAGSHWDEQLVGLPDGVRIVAYGVGAKPVLDCSDAIANASFAATGATVNVYDVSLTNDDVTAGKTHHSVWEDGLRFVEVANVAACDATPGSYYIANHEANPMTLYVHASDSSDVTINGKLYEWSHRGYGLVVPTNGYAENVVTRRNSNNNGSLSVSAGATAINCEANEGSFHNAYAFGGTVLKGCTATDAYWSGGTHSYFVINQDNGAGQNVTLVNCQAINTAAYDGNATGFSGHYNVGPNPFGTILYDGCSVRNMGFGFGFTAGQATLIQYVDCSTDDVQFPFDPNNNFTLSGGSILNTGAGINIRGVTIDTAGVAATISSGFTVNVPNVSGGAIYLGAAVTVTIDGCNIFVTSGAGVRTGVFCNNAGANLTVTNTDFDGTFVKGYDFTAIPTYTSDYNHFNPATMDMRIGGVTYPDIATYQVGTGQDAHSTTG